MLAPEAHVDEQETLNLEAVGPRPTRRTGDTCQDQPVGLCGVTAGETAKRDVAQLGSAPGLGPGGRRFESGHPD
jgi:hypothetical protein